VVLGSVVAGAACIVEPSMEADATLQPTGSPPDPLIPGMLQPPETADSDIALASLRGFGEHDGVDRQPTLPRFQGSDAFSAAPPVSAQTG
jgi:hypothetical protein